MPSAAEQLAANFNFSAFSKATELKNRIVFTLAALVVARLGTYVPMPGIDASSLAQQIQQQQGGLLDVFNLLGRRRDRAHGDLCARHHALHLGLDHHPADDDRFAAP